MIPIVTHNGPLVNANMDILCNFLEGVGESKELRVQSRELKVERGDLGLRRGGCRAPTPCRSPTRWDNGFCRPCRGSGTTARIMPDYACPFRLSSSRLQKVGRCPGFRRTPARPTAPTERRPLSPKPLSSTQVGQLLMHHCGSILNAC